MKNILAFFIKELIEESAKKIVKEQLQDSIRVEFLRVVAEGHSKEVAHNISQYVKSIEAASVEISSGYVGEKLQRSLQNTFEKLESELENQGPESPIVQYLQNRYGKNVSVIGKTTSPVYSIVSGFSENSNSDAPWRNRVIAEDSKINNILSKEASRLFEQIFPTEVSRTL